MTDHPMFLEFDGASNTYRSHLCGAFTLIDHSFETLAAARHALRLVGLRIGAKTDSRTWRIDSLNLSASALTSPAWEVGPIGIALDYGHFFRFETYDKAILTPDFNRCPIKKLRRLLNSRRLVQCVNNGGGP